METKVNKNILDDILANIPENEVGITEYRMDLAVKIDKAMRARGLQKQELAEKLGKKPSVITKWLSGTHNFTSDTLWQVERESGIKLLNLSPETQTEKVYIYTTSVNNAPVQMPAMPESSFEKSAQTHFSIVSGALSQTQKMVS